MRKYTAKDCACWAKYPNKNYKRDDQWKCVDCYELVKDGDYRHKTRCRLKEDGRDEQEERRTKRETD